MSDPVREALMLAESHFTAISVAPSACLDTGKADRAIALMGAALAALDRERQDRYLAGWRAGRDAAADLCAVCMPEYVAVGEENHADAASFLECVIRALPDPEPCTPAGPAETIETKWQHK